MKFTKAINAAVLVLPISWVISARPRWRGVFQRYPKRRLRDHHIGFDYGPWAGFSGGACYF